MARKPLIRHPSHPYHVVNRTHNKAPFPVPLPTAWNLFSDAAFSISLLYGVQIHALVMMSNHYHLLLTTPACNLDDAMQYFQSEISRKVNRIAEESAHMHFISRYKPSLISTERYLWHALKYVYRNPIQAGLSKTAEVYPYSSLAGQLGYSSLNFPLSPLPFTSYPDIEIHLADINTPYSQSEQTSVQRALRRREFSFAKQAQTPKS